MVLDCNFHHHLMVVRGWELTGLECNFHHHPVMGLDHNLVELMGSDPWVLMGWELMESECNFHYLTVVTVLDCNFHCLRVVNVMMVFHDHDYHDHGDHDDHERVSCH
jgi:hypothetical protein